MNNNSKILFAP